MSFACGTPVSPCVPEMEDKYIYIYKDIYSPMTFKCTQEFVLATFHSYSVLTTDKTLQFVMYKSYKVKFNNVTISFIYTSYINALL